MQKRALYIILPRSGRVIWNGNIYATTMFNFNGRKIRIISAIDVGNGTIELQYLRRKVSAGKQYYSPLLRVTLVCTMMPIPRGLPRLQRKVRNMHLERRIRRRVAIAMAFHPRLGAGSGLRVVDAAVVGAMVVGMN